MGSNPHEKLKHQTSGADTWPNKIHPNAVPVSVEQTLAREKRANPPPDTPGHETDATTKPTITIHLGGRKSVVKQIVLGQWR